MTERKFDTTQDEIRIVLIGKSGSGKSRTGNFILGLAGSDENSFQFETSAESVTQVCELKTTHRYGFKLDVVDTPGIFDSRKNNAEVQNEIKNCFLKTSPGIHAILLCVSMGRFTGESIDMLTHFVGYFGPYLYEYVIVVFTHLDEWKEVQEDKQEDTDPEKHYIEKLQKHLQTFIYKSACRYCFFDNNLDLEDDYQVKILLEIIQSNIHRNNGKCFTNALYDKVEGFLQEKGNKYSREELKQKKLLTSSFLMSLGEILSVPIKGFTGWC